MPQLHATLNQPISRVRQRACAQRLPCARLVQSKQASSPTQLQSREPCKHEHGKWLRLLTAPPPLLLQSPRPGISYVVHPYICASDMPRACLGHAYVHTVLTVLTDGWHRGGRPNVHVFISERGRRFTNTCQTPSRAWRLEGKNSVVTLPSPFSSGNVVRNPAPAAGSIARPLLTGAARAVDSCPELTFYSSR